MKPLLFVGVLFLLGGTVSLAQNENSTTSLGEFYTPEAGLNEQLLDPGDLDNSLQKRLKEFRGEWHDNEVELNWKTHKGKNIYLYHLQRKYPNGVWRVLKRIPRKGRSGRSMKYAYRESINDQFVITYYYRLRMFDKQGNVFYSDPVKIPARIVQNNLEFKSLPGKNTFIVKTLEEDPTRPLKVKVSIADPAGKMLLDSTYIGFTISVKYNKLPVGFYTARLNFTDLILLKRLVKYTPAQKLHRKKFWVPEEPNIFSKKTADSVW